MTGVKKRNLFEEIREGLEAYRDHRDSLPRRTLSAPDVGATRETGCCCGDECKENEM